MFKTKYTISFIIILFFLFVTPSFLLAETTEAAPRESCAIYGIVLDQQGLPVPHAKVSLDADAAIRITDHTGHFCFSGGTTSKILSVQKAGFGQEVFPLEGYEFRKEINVTIRPAINESIVVTATAKKEEKLETTPVRIDLMPRKTIEVTASKTLADALEFAPGVRVESNCQNCNFTHVRLLGLDGAYSQILMDGLPLISSVSSVYGLEQIPSRMIERIEVIKGGGSVAYGAGSVAGAINIIPRQASKTGGYLENRLEWMNGTPNQSHHGLIDFVSKDRKTVLTTFGQVDRIKPLDFDGDGFTEVGVRSFEAVGTRLNRSLLNNKAELVLDFSHIHENRRGGNRLDQPEHMADIAESIKSRRTTTALSWRHYVRPDTDYSLTWSLAHTKRDTYYGAGMDPNAYGETSNPLMVVDSRLNHYRGKHTLSFGLQHSSDYLEDLQPAYDRLTDDVYRNSGVYAEHGWSFAPGWEAQYGLRVDKHSAVDSPMLSPRAALKWSPRSDLDLRATVARGSRAPQVFDEDLHITQVGGEGTVIRNQVDLKQESSTSFMLGGQWKPTRGHHIGLFEVNTFYTDLRDLFKVVDDDNPATDDREFSRINFGKAHVAGVEVNLGYGHGGIFCVEGGFVVQRGLYGEADPDFGSTRFFKTPTVQGNMNFFWNVPRLGELFFGMRHTGIMDIPHYAGYVPEDRLDRSKRSTILDAGFTYNLPFVSENRMALTIGVKNLTNSYQDDLDQGPDRDAGYIWGPRFPRTFSIGLKTSF